jgi:microcystin-dependent protein
MGGSSANRLTAVTGSVDGDVLGGTGGEETHTISTAEMPSHSHAVGKDTGGVASGADVALAGSNTSGSFNSGSTGGGDAHNNVQPTIILNYAIKT